MPHAQPCQLCGRCLSLLTRHHLVPRTRHANKRKFERKEVKHRIVWLCRACHDQLHALFDEKLRNANTPPPNPSLPTLM
jgi:hypothetical protein